MKKLQVMMLALAATLTFTSCSSDSDEPAVTVSPEEQLTNNVYHEMAGTWYLVGMDFDGNIVSKKLAVSLPESGSADYGKYLYADADSFLVGSTRAYNFNFRMPFTFNAADSTGTVGIETSFSRPVGKLNESINIFFITDGYNEAAKKMEYMETPILGNFDSTTDLKAGSIRLSRTASLYVEGGKAATWSEDTDAGMLNNFASLRLQRTPYGK